MNQHKQLSNVTKEYLSCYYNILKRMICDMTEVDLNDSISRNFILQMIPHHMAAIDMSRNLLNYTTNVKLQNIAISIISEQTKSIRDMRDVLCGCGMICSSHRDICLYQRRFTQITRTMFNEMGSARTVNNINTDFICEMIPHHRGAIRMSRNALDFNICPELKPILNEIITSQSRGIAQMERLLKCGCK